MTIARAIGLGLLVAWGAGAPHATAAAAPDRRLGRIRAEIRRQGLAWTAAQTGISRLPEVTRLRYRRSPLPGVLLARFRAQAPRPPGVAPAQAIVAPSIDWRDHQGFNWITPIRDQGRCGACWAFATVAAVEALVSWRRSTPDPLLDLSEQHLLDCANASLSCDSGGITWDLPFIGGAGTFFQQTGLTSEACYPYTSGDSGTRGLCAPPTGACANDTLRTDDLEEIASTLPGWPLWDPPPFELTGAAMEEIKAHLAERPVGTSMRTYADLDYYTSGVYEPTSTSGASGLHAVLLVGYDDAGGYWIVKNSWGPDWGENGFFRIRYNTSSIGMFSFVYLADEDRKDPAFCGDLPTEISFPDRAAGTWVPLALRNCGSGVLSWTASIAQGWLALEDEQGGAVTAGSEVAAGTTYRLRLVVDAPPGARTTLTLSGPPQGPRTVAVVLPGESVADGGVADGGQPPDAGLLEDAGTAADAGTGVDAGAPTDAGTPADGGGPRDAGATADAGPTGGVPPAGGCAQATGAPPPTWLLWLLLCLLARPQGTRSPPPTS